MSTIRVAEPDDVERMMPLVREFYVYEPPRPLDVIEADIKGLEEEILRLLKEATQ